MTEKTPLKTLLKRGWSRRCPRCGEGTLFSRFINVRNNCSQCDLEFEPNRGDTWFFWTIGDRVFVAGTLIALFFGFRPTDPLIKWSWLAFLVISFVLTMPHRMGICIALDYFGRQRGVE